MTTLAKLAGKPRLTLDHHFGAPPADVYRAWVEPHQLTMWFGPAGAVVLKAECDARTGGTFHIHYRALDGEEHQVSGVYHEVVPEERLTFTWVWDREPQQESLVSVTLAPDGSGTAMTLTHEHLFSSGAQTYLRASWASAFDRLEHYLAEQTTAS